MKRVRDVGLAVFAAMCAAICVVGFSLRAPGPEGPRANLPALRVDAHWIWSSAPNRAIVDVRDGTFLLHVLYEPEDGGPRTREIEKGGELPWPRGAEGRWERPAVLFRADGDEPWWGASRFGDRFAEVWPTAFLGGYGFGGALGSVPLCALPNPTFRRLGDALTTHDVPRNGIELRITRHGDQVRYVWGEFDFPALHRPEEVIGDTYLADGVLRGGAGGPALPDLSALLSERLRIGRRGVVIVFLRAGTGVRYRDVLRGVEAGGGHPRIVFLPWPKWRLRQGFGLPNVTCRAVHEALVVREDDWMMERRVRVTVLPDGTYAYHGNALSRGELTEELGRYSRLGDCVLLLQADSRAPWPSCLFLLEHARELNMRIQFAYSLADPGFGLESRPLLPPPGEGAVRLRPDGPDETWGEMFEKIVGAVRAGAKAIEFE